MSLYLNHIAALSLKLTQPIQPRLPGIFESTTEINQALNEPAESSNQKTLTPGQKNHAEPFAQTNHHAPMSTPEAHFSGLIEQSQNTSPIQSHEPIHKPSIITIVNPQQETSNPAANPPQPEPAHETLNADLRLAEQNINTPLFNKIEIAEPFKPEAIQPVTSLKTNSAPPVTESEQRYKPAVERIIEHTLVERFLNERGENLSPAPTKQMDSAEHTKPSILDEPIPNVTADPPNAPQIKQQSPVADLKPANTVIVHEKFALEPHVQVRTQPKQPPIFEAPSNTHTEPTVQVSIGRIEIRATQNTDKAPVKPSSANATLSLDDYLKQRNGGRL